MHEVTNMAYFIFKAFWFLIAILILLIGYGLIQQHNHMNGEFGKKSKKNDEKDQE